jgi:AcrR family transcriptional regulator
VIAHIEIQTFDPKEGRMPAPEDPIRKKLIEARRTQILDAATAVFVEKGFHRATTREIASVAGVSEGTIYNYFDSKGDLLIGIMARLAELESLNEELMRALQGDVREFFVTMFRHRIGHLWQGQEMLQAILPEVIVNPELRERFHREFVLRIAMLVEQYIQTRVEMGHIRPVDASLTTRVVQAMFIGLLILDIIGDETLHSGRDRVPELLATIIFDGLRPRATEGA